MAGIDVGCPSSCSFIIIADIIEALEFEILEAAVAFAGWIGIVSSALVKVGVAGAKGINSGTFATFEPNITAIKAIITITIVAVISPFISGVASAWDTTPITTAVDSLIIPVINAVAVA